MINSYGSKKMYFKILYSLILLSLGVIILISVIFSNIYTNAAYNEISNEHYNSLSQMAIELGKFNDEIDSIYVSLISNPYVEAFLTQDKWDAYEEYKVSKEFSRFKSIHTNIHSIYLYNARINYFICNEYNSGDYTQFYDNKIINGISKPKTVFSRSIKSTSLSMPNGQKVLTYIYTKFDTDNKIEHSIIINSWDYFKENSKKVDNRRTILLVDKTAKVLSYSNPKTNFSDFDTDFVRQVISKSETRSVWKQKVNNNEYNISTVGIKKNGLYLISIQDYNGFTDSIRVKRNQVIYISLIVLLISGIAIYFISKTVYSPIDTLIKTISKTDYPRNRKKKKDELDYVMDSFIDTLERVSVLNQKNETNKTELKEGFIRQLLTERYDEAYLQEKFNQYELSIEVTDLMVISISIDEFHKVKQSHRLLYENTMYQIVKDILSERYRHEIASMSGGLIVAIVNVEISDYQPLKSILYEIKGSVYNTLNKGVTIGIGTRVDTIGEIKKSFEYSTNMISNRFTLGYGQIIDDEYVNTNMSLDYTYPLHIEEEFISSIRQNKLDEFSSAIKKLQNHLDKYVYNNAMLILTQVSLVCIKNINNFTSESNRNIQIDFKDFSNKLKEMEVISQGMDWLLELFLQYQKIVEEINLQKNSSKITKIVNETKEFIRENYADFNLSVELLADRFKYTPNYFAKLFKDSTGIFVNDYIRKIRISKAKELLSVTDLSINEIADITGFANKNYFYYAFKKEIGLTPTAYRSQNITRQ